MSDLTPDYYRGQIRDLLKRVPAKVNAAGHGTAVAYKEAVAFANKQLISTRATLLNLKAAMQKLQAYEG